MLSVPILLLHRLSAGIGGNSLPMHLLVYRLCHHLQVVQYDDDKLMMRMIVNQLWNLRGGRKNQSGNKRLRWPSSLLPRAPAVCYCYVVLCVVFYSLCCMLCHRSSNPWKEAQVALEPSSKANTIVILLFLRCSLTTNSLLLCFNNNMTFCQGHFGQGHQPVHCYCVILMLLLSHTLFSKTAFHCFVL